MNRKELIAILLLATVVAVGLLFRLYYGDTPAARSSTVRHSRPAAPASNGESSFAVSQRVPISPKARQLLQRAEAAFSYAVFARAAGPEHLDAVIEAAAGMYRTFCTQYSEEDAVEWALLRVAQCYTLQKLYPEAARAYDDLIVSYPNSEVLPMALLWSGECHTRLGNIDKARKRLEQVIARQPKSQMAQDAARRLEALDAQKRDKVSAGPIAPVPVPAP